MLPPNSNSSSSNFHTTNRSSQEVLALGQQATVEFLQRKRKHPSAEILSSPPTSVVTYLSHFPDLKTYVNSLANLRDISVHLHYRTVPAGTTLVKTPVSYYSLFLVLSGKLGIRSHLSNHSHTQVAAATNNNEENQTQFQSQQQQLPQQQQQQQQIEQTLQTTFTQFSAVSGIKCASFFPVTSSSNNHNKDNANSAAAAVGSNSILSSNREDSYSIFAVEDTEIAYLGSKTPLHLLSFQIQTIVLLEAAFRRILQLPITEGELIAASRHFSERTCKGRIYSNAEVSSELFIVKKGSASLFINCKQVAAFEEGQMFGFEDGGLQFPQSSQQSVSTTAVAAVTTTLPVAAAASTNHRTMTATTKSKKYSSTFLVSDFPSLHNSLSPQIIDALKNIAEKRNKLYTQLSITESIHPQFLVSLPSQQSSKKRSQSSQSKTRGNISPTTNQTNQSKGFTSSQQSQVSSVQQLQQSQQQMMMYSSSSQFSTLSQLQQSQQNPQQTDEQNTRIFSRTLSSLTKPRLRILGQNCLEQSSSSQQQVQQQQQQQQRLKQSQSQSSLTNLTNEKEKEKSEKSRQYEVLPKKQQQQYLHQNTQQQVQQQSTFVSNCSMSSSLLFAPRVGAQQIVENTNNNNLFERPPRQTISMYFPSSSRHFLHTLAQKKENQTSSNAISVQSSESNVAAQTSTAATTAAGVETALASPKKTRRTLSLVQPNSASKCGLPNIGGCSTDVLLFQVNDEKEPNQIVPAATVHFKPKVRSPHDVRRGKESSAFSPEHNPFLISLQEGQTNNSSTSTHFLHRGTYFQGMKKVRSTTWSSNHNNNKANSYNPFRFERIASVAGGGSTTGGSSVFDSQQPFTHNGRLQDATANNRSLPKNVVLESSMLTRQTEAENEDTIETELSVLSSRYLTMQKDLMEMKSTWKKPFSVITPQQQSQQSSENFTISSQQQKQFSKTYSGRRSSSSSLLQSSEQGLSNSNNNNNTSSVGGVRIRKSHTPARKRPATSMASTMIKSVEEEDQLESQNEGDLNDDLEIERGETPMISFSNQMLNKYILISKDSVPVKVRMRGDSAQQQQLPQQLGSFVQQQLPAYPHQAINRPKFTTNAYLAVAAHAAMGVQDASASVSGTGMSSGNEQAMVPSRKDVHVAHLMHPKYLAKYSHPTTVQKTSSQMMQLSNAQQQQKQQQQLLLQSQQLENQLGFSSVTEKKVNGGGNRSNDGHRTLFDVLNQRRNVDLSMAAEMTQVLRRLQPQRSASTHSIIPSVNRLIS